MIRCYAIAKPPEIVRIFRRATKPQIGAVSGMGTAASVDGLGFNPFSPAALILVLPALVIAYAKPVSLRMLWLVTVALLICSLIPALVFYPVVHTMMGAFATLAVLCYCLLATAVGVGRRFLHHREASTREISERAGINRTSAGTGRSFAGSL